MKSAHSRQACTALPNSTGETPLTDSRLYLQGIDNAEIINTIHARTPPMMPASAALRL
jgi:hypothetical protein